MKWNIKAPCESCPYRKDSKLAFWDKAEFAGLLEQDANHITGHVFGCHQTRKHPEPTICAGWLLNQKNRGLPSIQLRMRLIKSEEARTCLVELTDGGNEQYGSIEEMVEANFPELLEDQ